MKRISAVAQVRRPNFVAGEPRIAPLSTCVVRSSLCVIAAAT